MTRVRSLLARLRARLARFQADRRAQILPLVCWGGIAFFTSVILVVNTGRTNLSQIRAQNAIDAAAVSGANSTARAMNYVAQNNISMAKLLATVALLRAFEGAFDRSEATLAGVETVAILMQAAPWPPVVVAGRILHRKVQQEQAFMARLRPFWQRLSDFWDRDGEGLAWTGLRFLTRLGDAIVAWSPVLALSTAKEIYRRNLARGEGGEIATAPLVPRPPLCRGPFGAFFPRTRDYAQRWSEPIRRFARWTLTLSFFEFHYQDELRSELNEMFTGSGIPSSIDDPDAERLERDTRRIEELDLEIRETEARLAAAEDPEEIESLQDRLDRLREERDRVSDRIEETQRRISESPRRPPAGWTDELGGLQGEAQEPGDIYPYLVDGAHWPARFTFVFVGSRRVGRPLVPLVFGDAVSEGEPIVYAGARVFNPTRADSWTPDWRAKLVHVRGEHLEDLSTEPPEGCEQPATAVGTGAALLSGGLSLVPEMWLLGRFVDEAGKH